MRRVLIGLFIVIALCAGGWLSPAGAQNNLTALLAQVPDTSAARTVIWYSAPAALSAALGVNITNLDDVNALDASIRRAYLLEAGTQMYISAYSGFADAAGWQQKYGINSFAITRELTVGINEDQLAILQGSFDAGAIGAAFTALGYQSATEGSTTIYRAADSSAEVSALALTATGLLIAPPDQIAAVLAPSSVLAADPSFAAVATVLEDDNLAGGSLISAVIYAQDYLTDTIFARQLNTQIGAIRSQIGLDEFPLSPFAVAGIGYRFDGNQRQWVVALAYDDPNAAAQAAAALQGRLESYTSLHNPGDLLFQNWLPQSSTHTVGNVSVAIAVMNAQADVAWAALMAAQDIGFLAN